MSWIRWIDETETARCKYFIDYTDLAPTKGLDAEKKLMRIKQ